MAKELKASDIVSSRLGSIIFGITIIVLGIFDCLQKSELTSLLPDFLNLHDSYIYLLSFCYILAGIAIIINRPIARTASFLLAVLLIGVTVVVDLRGYFDTPDSINDSFFIGNGIKNFGLAAGAIVIANLERKPVYSHHSHHHRHHRSSSRQVQTTENSVD